MVLEYLCSMYTIQHRRLTGQSHSYSLSGENSIIGYLYKQAHHNNNYNYNKDNKNNYNKDNKNNNRNNYNKNKNKENQEHLIIIFHTFIIVILVKTTQLLQKRLSINAKYVQILFKNVINNINNNNINIDINNNININININNYQ